MTKTTEGVRVHSSDEDGFWLREGDYGRNPADGKWYGRPPGTHMGGLEAHEVTEHKDGTITVSPSILVTTHEGTGRPHIWHGYLERGIWREV